MTYLFQSTLPRGERRFAPLHQGKSRIGFNPRSHGGSDAREMMRVEDIFGFNPRSHGGSDVERADVRRHEAVSIHAPTGGATRTTRPMGGNRQFQSTLPRGERLHVSRAISTSPKFQSTLPRGERQVTKNVLPNLSVFQSTLPRGGAT